MKLDLKSNENSVDPDQLASSADQDLHCFPYIIMNQKLNTEMYKSKKGGKD